MLASCLCGKLTDTLDDCRFGEVLMLLTASEVRFGRALRLELVKLQDMKSCAITSKPLYDGGAQLT